MRQAAAHWHWQPVADSDSGSTRRRHRPARARPCGPGPGPVVPPARPRTFAPSFKFRQPAVLGLSGAAADRRRRGAAAGTRPSRRTAGGSPACRSGPAACAAAKRETPARQQTPAPQSRLPHSGPEPEFRVVHGPARPGPARFASPARAPHPRPAAPLRSRSRGRPAGERAAAAAAGPRTRREGRPARDNPLVSLSLPERERERERQRERERERERDRERERERESVCVSLPWIEFRGRITVPPGSGQGRRHGALTRAGLSDNRAPGPGPMVTGPGRPAPRAATPQRSRDDRPPAGLVVVSFFMRLNSAFKTWHTQRGSTFPPLAATCAALDSEPVESPPWPAPTGRAPGPSLSSPAHPSELSLVPVEWAAVGLRARADLPPPARLLDAALRVHAARTAGC
jgi:hypothetical protein